MTDRDKAYAILMDMKDEIILKDRITNPSRRAEFVEYAKEFYRYNLDMVHGFMLEFKSDYEAIRKKELTKTKS